MADLVRWGASRLAEHGVALGHGTDDPVDEALALVLHALHLEPGLAPELWAARVTRAERVAALALLVRRVRERLPAAYLTGRAWFAGLPFSVDTRVLVPRSPIAELIERGFAPWVEPEEVRRVLDLGTGSGCIAVACALAFPRAEVDAVDVSAPALEVAAANVAAYGLESRVRLLEGDLFGPVTGRYDIVVSNPPYVPATSLAELPPEYRHEPRLGLEAGEEGTALIARILDAAPRHLAPGGVLVVEAGECRAALERRFPDLPFEWPEFERGGGDVLVLPARALDR